MFGDTEFDKNKFYRYKSPIFYKMQILKMYEHLIKFPHVKKNYKYFIGYLYDDCRVKPVHIALSKTSACVKSYDGQTKWMYFFNGT